MANVVIIENDQKDVNEISRYVKELGKDNQIRNFPTPELFLKRYNVAPGDELNESVIEHLSAYPDSDLPKLKDLSFKQAPGFRGSKMVFQWSRDENKTVVKKITVEDPGRIWDLDADKIMNHQNFFEEHIPSDFHLGFENGLDEADDSEVGAKFFIPITVMGNSWFVLAHVESKNDYYNITFTDHSKNAKTIIGKAISARGGDNGGELDKLSSIDLIVFNFNLIEGGVHEWVMSTRAMLQKHKMFPPEKVTRFIVTKFEDDGVPKSKLFHPYIDDMLTMPFDRLLFLQKLEIVLTLPERKKPTFLFLQPVAKSIDISKKSKLSGINDVGISVINPIPLRSGLASSFYFKFPGDESHTCVTTKSSSSKPNPEDPATYITHFDYFGLKRDEMLKVKGYLRKLVEYKELTSTDEAEFTYSPENIFLTDEDKRVKTAIVLEMNDQNRAQMVSSLNENISQIQVVNESSFYLFEKKYLETDNENVIPLKEHELYEKRIVWKVDAETYNFIEVINAPNEEDMICGRKAEQFFSGIKEWKMIFSEDSMDMLIQSLNDLDQGTMDVFVDVPHEDETNRTSKVSLRKDEDQIEMCLTVPSPEDLEGEMLESIDCFVMDFRMIPEVDFEEWYKNLTDKINEKKLNPSGGKIKIIATADPAELEDHDYIRLQQIPVDSLVFKPVDTKALCYHFSRLSNAPFTRYVGTNIGWMNVGWTTYAAKRAKVEEISEFGCTIRTKKPLKIGTTIFLHGFIYDNAPDGCLCARLYSFEEDNHEDGNYLCYFSYFGIDDSFLKYTRSWIRENYAQSKAQSS